MIAEVIAPALFFVRCRELALSSPHSGARAPASSLEYGLPPHPSRSASRSKTHRRPRVNQVASQIHAAHTPDDKACRPALKALLRTEPAFSRSSNSAPPAEPPSAARAVRRKSYPPSTRRSYPRRQSLLPSIESAFIASGLLTTSCTYSSLLSYY